jgi:hypothetical protein
LSVDKLENLTWALGAIAADGVLGDVIEAGVALGGSGIVLASGMGPRRRFAGYDVFGMLPARGEADDAKSHARYEVIASGASKGLGGEQASRARRGPGPVCNEERRRGASLGHAEALLEAERRVKTGPSLGRADPRASEGPKWGEVGGLFSSRS